MTFHASSQMPLIHCARCSKPVDKIHAERNFASDSLLFVVECHGEEDRCEIDRYFLDTLDGPLREGVAFMPKGDGLPAPLKQIENLAIDGAGASRSH